MPVPGTGVAEDAEHDPVTGVVVAAVQPPGVAEQTPSPAPSPMVRRCRVDHGAQQRDGGGSAGAEPGQVIEPEPDADAPRSGGLADRAEVAARGAEEGEAFSVLEDRDSPVELPGVEPGEPISTLQLPEHLFVIGTMNLIDQSLEQIDFALRRRFFWQRSSFDSTRLEEV